MSDDFEPMESDRQPRAKGFSEEPDELAELLKNRGDQRIGQLILNAVSHHYSKRLRHYDDPVEYQSAVENLIFNVEDDELVEAVEEFVRSSGRET